MSDSNDNAWLLAHRSIYREHRRNNRESDNTISNIQNVSARRNSTMISQKVESVFIALGIASNALGNILSWLVAHQNDATAVMCWGGLVFFVVGAYAKIKRWIKNHGVDDK